MSETPAALNDLGFMKALLDLVIPPRADARSIADVNLAGAGELGLAPDVASALQADPMLGPLAEAGAQAVREAALSQHPQGLQGMESQAGAKVIQDQLATHPLFIMGISRYLFPAYYQHPQVLDSIGEPPRPPFPKGFGVEETDAKLLEKLQARRKT